MVWNVTVGVGIGEEMEAVRGDEGSGRQGGWNIIGECVEKKKGCFLSEAASQNAINDSGSLQW
ncbi:hypothetical protein KTO58_18680 [Chitinophaga pendula]|uniref:hypothetical protein n=1 Tax=Chitinophaga TaxID=79328 RepID=UPI000BB0BDD6|nr:MULTISPECIES: hypothetical protein [Chitinophaga]ASZ11296.1 hypothetical protein CK934_10130 [Chitinophaga sp. MD30]UCJ05702.1 hypothetical protein KTO58_18680 [Chitinophaga pendula]